MNKKKVLAVRIAAVLALVVIAAVMMVIGRGHTVYFDCKDLEYNGTTYEAPYKVEVSVKGERVAKLYEKERGMTTNVGQNFKMSLEITEKKGGDSTVQEISLKLPYSMDGIVINLPGLLAGLPEEAYLEEFVQVIVEEDTEEVPGEGDDLMGDDMMGDI